MTDIEYIRLKLPETEQLAQLAEECSELAQAALKLRRVVMEDSVNPTPCGVVETIGHLQEEIADVLVCLQVTEYIGEVSAYPLVEEIMDRKTRRWARRLGRKEEDIE